MICDFVFLCLIHLIDGKATFLQLLPLRHYSKRTILNKSYIFPFFSKSKIQVSITTLYFWCEQTEKPHFFENATKNQNTRIFS